MWFSYVRYYFASVLLLACLKVISDIYIHGLKMMTKEGSVQDN